MTKVSQTVCHYDVILLSLAKFHANFQASPYYKKPKDRGPTFTILHYAGPVSSYSHSYIPSSLLIFHSQYTHVSIHVFIPIHRPHFHSTYPHFHSSKPRFLTLFSFQYIHVSTPVNPGSHSNIPCSHSMFPIWFPF